MTKSYISKIVSYVLMIAIFAQLIPIEVFASTTTEEIEPLIMGELKQKREQNIKVFIKEDYTNEAVIYPSPVHYLLDGKWVDIDNNLIQDGEDVEYLTNKANDFDVKVAKQSTTEKLIKLDVQGYEIGWGLENVQNSSIVIEDHIEGLESLSYNERIKYSDNTMSSFRYNDIFENVDLQYLIDSNELKENIIINEKTDNNVFTFHLYTDGLTARLVDRNVLLYNHQNELIYKIPAPFMYDEQGEISNNIDVHIEETDEGYILIILPNQEWINDTNRAFPIIVDPIITTSQEKDAIDDTHISQNAPYQNYEGAVYTKVGKGSISGINRTYIIFPGMYLDFRTILEGADILDAKLHLYRQNSNAGTTLVELYQINEYWNAENIVWNSQPKDIKPRTSTLVSGPGKYSWDITDTIEDWYINDHPNRGIMLQTGTLDGEYIQFYSANTSLAYKLKRPQISISYSDDYIAKDLGDFKPIITPQSPALGDEVRIFIECLNAHHIAGKVTDPDGNSLGWIESDTDDDDNGKTDLEYIFKVEKLGTYKFELGARNTPDDTHSGTEVKRINDTSTVSNEITVWDPSYNDINNLYNVFEYMNHLNNEIDLAKYYNLDTDIWDEDSWVYQDGLKIIKDRQNEILGLQTMLLTNAIFLHDAEAYNYLLNSLNAKNSFVKNDVKQIKDILKANNEKIRNQFNENDIDKLTNILSFTASGASLAVTWYYVAPMILSTISTIPSIMNNITPTIDALKGKQVVDSLGNIYTVYDFSNVATMDLSLVGVQTTEIASIIAANEQNILLAMDNMNNKLVSFSDEGTGKALTDSAKKSLGKIDIANFEIKSKHLDIPNNTSTWNKFNVDTVEKANSLVDTILNNAKNDSSLIKHVMDNGLGSNGQQSFKVWIDAGKVIGTKGETAIRIVYDELGNIWTVFPDKLP